MVILKSEEEIKGVRKSSQIVASVLDMLKSMVKPGITTAELDSYAEKIIKKNGALPAFKGYKGYPSSICASINEEVVHGIPSGRRLKEGDIISIDLGVNLNGFFGDAAITVPVGKISSEVERLLMITEEALSKGIEKARVDNRISDISSAIQFWVEESGYSVVKKFVGHGIGMNLHEDPQVPNFGPPNQGMRLKEGLILAIEPIVNMGSYDVEILSNGWTAVTSDKRLSAHFEHTVAITSNGPEVLTRLN